MWIVDRLNSARVKKCASLPGHNRRVKHTYCQRQKFRNLLAIKGALGGAGWPPSHIYGLASVWYSMCPLNNRCAFRVALANLHFGRRRCRREEEEDEDEEVSLKKATHSEILTPARYLALICKLDPLMSLVFGHKWASKCNMDGLPSCTFPFLC